jgi:death on curing protein
MEEPRWLSKRAVLAIHSEQLAEHGGSDGTRDETLLESALAKPQNVFAYGEAPDIFTLAASYAFGIARNRAFVDGNKRTALVVSMTFLDRNGWEIEAAREDCYFTFLHLAEGKITEDQLAAWFRAHAVRLGAREMER